MIKLPAFFNNPTFLVVREVRDQSSSLKILLASVIRRAVFDIALYKNDKKLVNRRLAVQASQWMFDDREIMDQHPLDRYTSFRSICEILDQDPKWIRDKTLELRSTDVKKFDRRP